MQFEQNKADALALSLQHDKSKKNFWQKLKMINKKSASYPTSVSGVSGASKVAEMWGNHFGSLLNSITNDSCNNVVQTSVNSIQYYNTTDFYCDQRWRNHFESGGPKVDPVFSPTAHNAQL